MAVDNTPPRIIVSNSPALLIPVDGAPVVRQAKFTAVAAVPRSGVGKVMSTGVAIAAGSSCRQITVAPSLITTSVATVACAFRRSIEVT